MSSWWDSITNAVGYQRAQEPVPRAAQTRTKTLAVQRKMEGIQQRRQSLNEQKGKALAEAKAAIRAGDLDTARFHIRIALSKSRAVAQCDKVLRMAAKSLQVTETADLANELRDVMSAAAELNHGLDQQVEDMGEVELDFHEATSAAEQLEGMFSAEDEEQNGAEEAMLQQLIQELRMEQLDTAPSPPYGVASTPSASSSRALAGKPAVPLNSKKK